MSFFFTPEINIKVKKQSTLNLSKHGCMGCSMQPHIKSRIKPEGSSNPDIYIVDTFSIEDRDYIIQNLKKVFTDAYINTKIRWNYLVQCHASRDITKFEIECCKNHLIKDVEDTKPLFILGFGELVLKSVLDTTNRINSIRGRKLPIKLGKHKCWFMPIYSADYILSRKREYPTEWEHVFLLDIKNAKKQLDSYTEPEYIEKGYDNGVSMFIGGSVEELEHQLAYFIDKPVIAVDIENRPLKPRGSNRILATMAVSDFTNSFAFPIEYPDAWKSRDLPKVFNVLRWFLLRSKLKICHNLQHEIEWFYTYLGKDVVWKTQWGCTQAQAYTIDERPGAKNDSVLSLNSCTIFNLGFALKSLNKVNLKDCTKTSLPDLLRYNAMDSKWTFRLHEIQDSRIEPSQRWVYNHLVDLEKTLAITQAVGVPIDVDVITTQSKEYEKQLIKTDKIIIQLPEVVEFKRIYKKDFNILSTDHVGLVLEKILKLPKLKGTDTTDSYSTDDEVLEQFVAQDIEFAKHVLDYREITKVKSTYLDSVLSLVSMDSKIHCSFSAMFTSTGRLNSTEPNLQNAPRRKHKEVRRMLAAPKGYWLVASDYGQIEARCIAMLSKDENFVKAIWDGYDIHREWALYIAELTGQTLNKVELKKLRDRVKNQLVFPAFFGSSKNSIKKAFSLTDKIADKLFEAFWIKFSGVKQWQYKLKQFYSLYGYVETLTGRRRHAPLSYTELCNAPVQGTSSDIVTDAMNRVAKLSYSMDLDYLHPILNIHDDLSYLVPDSELEPTIELIAKEMCRINFDFINVPLSVEVSIGRNWCDMNDIGQWTTQDFKY